MTRNPSPSAFSIDDNVFINPEDPRRSKTRMNILLVFALVILVVGTLLTLDFLLPACMSAFRPCFTISGVKWIASKKRQTREESREFCESRGYKTATISVAKEIFEENKEILDQFGNFWIIGKKYVKIKFIKKKFRRRLYSRKNGF